MKNRGVKISLDIILTLTGLFFIITSLLLLYNNQEVAWAVLQIIVWSVILLTIIFEYKNV